MALVDKAMDRCKEGDHAPAELARLCVLHVAKSKPPRPCACGCGLSVPGYTGKGSRVRKYATSKCGIRARVRRCLTRKRAS